MSKPKPSSAEPVARPKGTAALDAMVDKVLRYRPKTRPVHRRKKVSKSNDR